MGVVKFPAFHFERLGHYVHVHVCTFLRSEFSCYHYDWLVSSCGCDSYMNTRVAEGHNVSCDLHME